MVIPRGRGIAKTREKSVRKEQLVVNVRESVRTAIEILTHLERSLLQGRFAEGVGSYRAMCDTLVGQRLWSLEVDDNEIDQLFQQLAEIAVRIHSVLAPYKSMMLKISAVAELKTDTVKIVVPASEVDENLEDEAITVIEALREYGKAMSVTRLQSKSGLIRKRLLGVLNELEAAGRITIARSGGRRVVVLAGAMA